NVSLFIEALQKNDPDVHFAFDNEMPGIMSRTGNNPGNYYIEATNYRSVTDKNEKLLIYLEGLDLFEKLFGYRSESIIPPNYIWSPDFSQYVLKKGAWIYQGIRKMREPLNDGRFKYHNITLGMKNEAGQLYLTRNSLFEPSMGKFGVKDPVNHCLQNIAAAFNMHKPAIISSHRINFAGMLDVSNRDKTLRLLEQLLSNAIKKWPDIEFMTSPQLAGTIMNSKH
ncbi:MAG: hypothetical protein IH591_12625, partial [Bacteroidales bacterium]|nr:hypothetical protein [Bacteroidales bacterium]